MTQNWKKTYEEYVAAQRKPSPNDPRYKVIEDKYKRMRDEADEKFYEAFGELETKNIGISSMGVQFDVDGNKWSSGYLSESDIKLAVKKGSEVLRKVIGSILVKEIGTMTMNRCVGSYAALYGKTFDEDFIDAEVLTDLVGQVNDILGRIDDGFTSRLEKGIAESEKLKESVNGYLKSKVNRFETPKKLRNRMVSEWWEEVGCQPGTSVAVSRSGGSVPDFWGKVESVKQGKNERIITLTDGSRIHESKIDIRSSFVQGVRISEGFNPFYVEGALTGNNGLGDIRH